MPEGRSEDCGSRKKALKPLSYRFGSTHSYHQMARIIAMSLLPLSNWNDSHCWKHRHINGR
ncbi:hypothetical protein J6590_020131 [Homalodisca vitripennis]|nr:hypothetical protein J6590_020131 [Homalodisca vitripennis]